MERGDKKLKAWKKGAIVGALWGLISGIYIFISGIGGFAGYLTPRSLLGNLFGITAFIGIYTSGYIRPIEEGSLLNFIVPWILSIFYGALLLGGLSYVISRRKNK